MFFNLFKNRNITTIYLWGMFIVLIFVFLFAMLLINEEYNDFDKTAKTLRKEYIAEQKKRIEFDTNRVLQFINYEYTHKRSTVDEEALKATVLSAIEQLYGRQDGTGYIFIYDFKGVNLSDPLHLHNTGENLYNYKDPSGIEVIKELIKISRQPAGGYVEYTWVKPITQVPTVKISYARSFEPWQWMVGTGVYLDEVEKLLSVKREALKKRVIKYMMEILSLTVILFGISLTGLGIINFMINREITAFRRFFKKAAKSHTSIDEEQIQLKEFRDMVKYVNTMVDAIHKRKQKLKKVNQNLEKRVEEKTRDLSEQNKLLEKEKEFNVSLVNAQDSFIKHSIHEINTPLAVIMMYIDMYKMKYGEENTYISKIEAASKMIATIYDDLSYMVKKDRFVYEKQMLSFSLFLEGRIEFFQEIAKGNQHHFITDIEQGIEIFFSDIELQRIIDNNLSNAIKYANKSSDIHVTLKKDEDEIVLYFLTYSRQIEDIKQIFEPFHQEEDKHGGFGLGLEIVQSICKKESVKFEVDSNELTTVFRYTFAI